MIELPRHYPLPLRGSMFGGADACPVLPYAQPPSKARYAGNGQRRSFSFSGAQDKYSMVLDGTTLRYREEGEMGSYILKPCPADAYMPHRKDAPANEDLCMGIMRRIFRLPTAESTLCYFGNGEAAYLTRRFDITPRGTTLHMEDYAALTDLQAVDSGRKYCYSYEELAAAIAGTSNAPAADILRFFRMVLANFLLCNGDAHLKNFALLGEDAGNMVLSPAYDVMNTRLHVQDADFALDRGLFADARQPGEGGMARHFLDWAAAIGIRPATAASTLKSYTAKRPRIEEAVAQSALSRTAQKAFLLTVRTRFKALGVRREKP